jgi:hypothetical protein
MIEELLDQWYGQEDAWYKVRADDGNIYILRHQTSIPDGTWDLTAFRRATRSMPRTNCPTDPSF